MLWCCTYTDISEQRDLSQRLRQLARVIELSHEAILVWDVDDGIRLWNKGCEELYGFSRSEAIGVHSHDLLSTRHPMDSAAFNDMLLEERSWTGELAQRTKSGADVWVDSRQEAIRAGGRNLILETNRDITEQRQAKAIQDLLVAELNHRVKNTLAIIQSIAVQTARTKSDMPSFIASFSGRLQSIAAAQSVLSDARWTSADLGALVTSQLAISGVRAEQTVVAGETVIIAPETALQLTLLLHELTTNALRFGSLSRRGGKVTIQWTRQDDQPEVVKFSWIESGGPAVLAPGSVGFGRRLIERTGKLPALSCALAFLPEGVQCHITLVSARDRDAGKYFNPGRRTL
ncbi:MAG: HWE histidine kinase domain-containing protein [Hyphomicrobiaceae bacterium]